jgi:voltage-gated potassium channel Kch
VDSPENVTIQIDSQKDNDVEIPHELPLRKWLYRWLLDPNIENNYQRDIDRWISFLIVANLFALLFEHVPAIYEPREALFHIFDTFSVAIFTLEYLVRLYLATEDEEFKSKKYPYLSYVISPFAIIDLLSILPFYLQAIILIDLRMLRFLRLLRILKLFRVLIPAYKEFVTLNQDRTFRQKIHALVFPSNYGGKLQNIFDSFIVIWVIISVLTVILESVSSIEYVLNIQFVILDTLAVAFFTIEYCMRLYSCVEEPDYQHAITGRLKMAKSTSSMIDFLAILPFFLEAFLHHLLDLRFLRVFRLLRLLKLTRYTGATGTLTTVIAREWPVLATSAFIMLLMVVLTASLGYLFEHEAQPDKFENIPQSIYWAVITLASVGYGDIAPITPLGRIMTIILALLGIGIFALPAALLSSAFTDQLRIERETLKNELYEMLSDGIISPEEADIISREAKRLHIGDEEVERLIEKARYDRELKDDIAGLPLHKVAATPTHAIEHYKTLISQIRQLGIMTDGVEFEAIALQNSRLSRKELALWHMINKM